MEKGMGEVAIIIITVLNISLITLKYMGLCLLHLIFFYWNHSLKMGKSSWNNSLFSFA